MSKKVEASSTVTNDNPSMLKKISTRIFGFFNKLVSTVVVGSTTNDGYTPLKNKKQAKTSSENSVVKDIQINTSAIEQDVDSETQDLIRDTKTSKSEHRAPKIENDEEDFIPPQSGSLFPNTIVVDHSLNNNATAIPCSLDMSLHNNEPFNMNMHNMNMQNTNMHNMNMTALPQMNNTENIQHVQHMQNFQNAQSMNNMPNMHSNVLMIPPMQMPVNTPMNMNSLNTPNSSPSDSLLKNKIQQQPSNELVSMNNTKENEEEQPHQPHLYVCHYCDAQFTVRGYLTRHIKKHAVEKAYHCPFFDVHLDPSFRCHPTGGFSRRDTYKTHLKTKHFIIPKGTSLKDRLKTPGNCGMCGEAFENSETWCEKHIATGSCCKLPEGFTSLPQKSSQHKLTQYTLKLIKSENGVARYISSKESIVEPKVFANREAVDIMAELAQESLFSPHSSSSSAETPMNHPSVESNGSSSSSSSSGGNNHGNLNGSTGPSLSQNHSYTPIIEKLSDNRIVIHSENIEGIKEIKNKKGKKKNALKKLASNLANANKKGKVGAKNAKIGRKPGVGPNFYGSVTSPPMGIHNANTVAGPHSQITPRSDDQSSIEDAGLEPIKSNSSQSSNESLRAFLNATQQLPLPVTHQQQYNGVPLNGASLTTSQPHFHASNLNNQQGRDVAQQLAVTKENFQHIQNLIPSVSFYNHPNAGATASTDYQNTADDYLSLDTEQQAAPYSSLYQQPVRTLPQHQHINKYVSPVPSGSTPVQYHQQQQQQYQSLDQSQTYGNSTHAVYDTGLHAFNADSYANYNEAPISKALISSVNDQLALSEQQVRETEQYRKFYEFTFQKPESQVTEK